MRVDQSTSSETAWYAWMVLEDRIAPVVYFLSPCPLLLKRRRGAIPPRSLSERLQMASRGAGAEQA